MNIAAMKRALEGETVEIASAPARFVEDFELVATHYQLREHGEYETAKRAARQDLDAAIGTFSTLAEEIRSGKA